MNTRSSAAPTRGIRIARIVGLALATTTLAVGLVACQTATETIPPVPNRAAPAAPLGIDLDRPADRIEDDLERVRAERGFFAGCRQYVLIEHGTAWRLECLSMRRG